MPSSLQSSRLARYSLAATAAAAGSGAAAVADTYSGSFDVSFGRVAGVGFFNGFTYTSVGSGSFNTGSVRLTMSAGSGNTSADLFLDFSAWTWSYGSASFTMAIDSLDGNDAYFNQLFSYFGTASSTASVAQLVNAGDVWTTGSTSVVRNILFTSSATSDGTQIWTNSNAVGTKFINFLLEGDDGDIYGWVQFDFDITDVDNWSVTVSNWAYTDDGPLAAGSTGAPVVPGLGGLAALAVGAAGVRGRRQRAAG